MIKDPSRKELAYFVDTFYKIAHLVGAMQTAITSLMNGVTVMDNPNHSIFCILVNVCYVVGGACSLSTLVHFGVATKNTRISMPETIFGHFCDVGSSFYLSRLNGHIGRYIAISPKTLVAEDVL
jgi:3-hydroxyisobutyryl-CoA hydrolase